MGCTETILRQKFIAINAYIKKKKDLKINYLITAQGTRKRRTNQD